MRDEAEGVFYLLSTKFLDARAVQKVLVTFSVAQLRKATFHRRASFRAVQGPRELLRGIRCNSRRDVHHLKQ